MPTLSVNGMCALALIALAPAAAAAQMAPPEDYELVWADEFDADGLPDPARWDYDTHRNREGWYNDELQYYSRERLKNARVEGGVLFIEAHAERLRRRDFPDWGGQRYTSARLFTRGIASWTYGFFEISAKLPCGYGVWPAIWTLAAESRDGWPVDGEIDIMEHVGADPGTVHGTVHTGAYNHADGTHRSAQIELPDVCEAFHRYQLHWTADRIVVGVDGNAYYEFEREPEGGKPAWPFDAPQYLLLNVAIGGWGGEARRIDDSVFPARMEVDYVRVYQAR